VATLNYNLNVAQAGNPEFLAFLEALKIKPAAFRTLQEEIGLALRESTTLRFVDEVDPSGVAWIPSERAIRENGQTLTDTTRLRTSITYAIGQGDIEIGTNVEYAEYLQNVDASSRPTTPERPFLGISLEDEETIQDIITQFVQELT
jgi:phage virion morphogenesis protein